MSKSSPLDQTFPEMTTEDWEKKHKQTEQKQVYILMHKKDPMISPRTGKPYRKQTPAQALASELNWDMAQLKGASQQLQHLSNKYKLVIPKIFFKDVPGADLIAGLEKELLVRVEELRKLRKAKLQEKAPIDNAPPVA